MKRRTASPRCCRTAWTSWGDREMCLARELTKKHEEFIRGRISEVLDMCDSLKGEMVVVMAGYQEEKEPDLTQAMR